MPSAAERLVSIETVVVRLDKLLIGEDGNGGVIRELRAADEKNEQAIAARHKENQDAMQKLKDRNTVMITAACTLIVFVSFLTGSGWAGVENVMKLLAK